MIGSKGGRRRERRREEREEEEVVKVGKEAEDGDKCNRDRMLGKVKRIWGGGGGGVVGSFDGQRRGGAAQGDNRFRWGPIGGVSVGEVVRKMMKEREGCMLTCFKSLYNTVTVGSYYS